MNGSKPRRGASNALLAGIFAISLTAGVATVASMGEPADITSEATDNDRADSIVLESSNNYDDVCRVPAEDSSTAHCTFNPTARYDYSNGAWREVPPTMRYANGNRPPTGQYLTDHPTPDGA